VVKSISIWSLSSHAAKKLVAYLGFLAAAGFLLLPTDFAA
jgi:hypothetical protein